MRFTCALSNLNAPSPAPTASMSRYASTPVPLMAVPPLSVEIEIKHTPLGSTDCVRLGAPLSPDGKISPAETPRILITRGSNRRAKTARPIGASDLSSTATRRVSPTFHALSDDENLSCAIRDVLVFSTAIGFVGKLVSTAFVAPPAPVLTAATCAASRLLIRDLGAGTKAGASPAATCTDWSRAELFAWA